jgi:DNA polymerase II small subunit/DNA polymerase delta subunit B
MEKSEIVKEFIRNGFQLDPKGLDYLVKKENVKYFLEELKKLPTCPLVVTLDILKEIEKKLVYDVKVIKTPKEKKELSSISDFINFFSQRYEWLRKLLTKHFDLVNLISINKITQKTRKFSLIVMVREKNEDEKSLVVEDFTGEETIFFERKEDFELILEDEVLGIVCEREGERIFAKKIVFPEIPLRKEINKTSEDAFCLFISDFHMEDKNFNKKSFEKFLNWINNLEYRKLYVLILGDVSSKVDDVETLFKNLPKNYYYVWLKGENDPEIETEITSVLSPCFLQVEKSLNFLLIHSIEFPSSWSSFPPNKILLNFLKKRQIPSSIKKIYVEDPYIIDVVPDFMASGHFHIPSLLNYKGTTILTTGSFVTEPTFWLANLRTRETIKIDFA